jgi:hypothetical protein
MSKKGQHQAIPLDLGRFASPEEALAEAARLTTSLADIAQRRLSTPVRQLATIN